MAEAADLLDRPPVRTRSRRARGEWRMASTLASVLGRAGIGTCVWGAKTTSVLISAIWRWQRPRSAVDSPSDGILSHHIDHKTRALPPRSACREGRCVPAPERPADGGTSGRLRPCCRGRACGARLRRQVAAPDRTGTRPPEQDALDAVANGLVGLNAPRRQGRWPSPLARDRHRRRPRPRRGRHPRARSVRLMCGRSLASLLRGWARGARNVTRGGCGPLLRSAAYADRP